MLIFLRNFQRSEMLERKPAQRCQKSDQQGSNSCPSLSPVQGKGSYIQSSVHRSFVSSVFLWTIFIKKKNYIPLLGRKVRGWRSWRQHRSYRRPSSGGGSSSLEVSHTGRRPSLGGPIPSLPPPGSWHTPSWGSPHRDPHPPPRWSTARVRGHGPYCPRGDRPRTVEPRPFDLCQLETSQFNT